MSTYGAAPQLTDAEAHEYIQANLGRHHLADFVRGAWHLVEPATALSWNWHLDYLCARLEAVTRGETKRLILNVPPGTGKSLFVSVFWSAWEWATDPSLRYLLSSYTVDNPIRDNRRLRSVLASDWYRRHYPGVNLASDQSAKVRFDTDAKGWRIATSVGGIGTGEHPDRIIIDDPTKAKDARSTVALAEARDWYDGTISTRVARDPAIVVVMQRLHETDLSGHLLAKGGWSHVCLPMRYDPSHQHVDAGDIRTEPGELLWPDLYPEDKVRELELELGEFGRAGQLQQNPVPLGGALYKYDWWEVVDQVRGEIRRRCRGWDTAATEGGGDWTVGVLLAEATDGVLYVEDVVRGQWGPAGVDKTIRATAEQDGRGVMVREEQEGGSAGKAVTTARAKRLRGFNYAGVPISGDKITRNQPFRAQVEAGNVRLVRGSWNRAYIDVMCSFPVGEHDDDADATSAAYNALVADQRQTRLTWGPRVGGR